MLLFASMKKRPLIEVRKLNKIYVSGEIETHVLHDVDLTIEEGEFVAIMGPSGSGKSTLMHILGFLDRATKGSYFFDNKNVSNFKEEKLAEMRTKEAGFVFQFFNLLSRATVAENVMLPMIYSETPVSKRRKMAEEALRAVGLDHRVDYAANKISGGEKQRTAIARALVNNPAVVFADEPTGNLDSKSGLEVLKIFQELNKKGITIIMVTHELEAAEFAKRIIEFRDGHIISDEKITKRRRHSFVK